MKRLLAALAFLFLVSAAEPARADVGFDARGAILVFHYVQSGWKTPKLDIATVALGPQIGGLYIGGVGFHMNGFGTVYPMATYVGQGAIPKLPFLRGFTVSFAMANEGVFSGHPAYLFGVGI